MTEETHQIIKDDGACLPPDWKKLKKSETKDINIMDVKQTYKKDQKIKYLEKAISHSLRYFNIYKDISKHAKDTFDCINIVLEKAYSEDIKEIKNEKSMD